MASDAFATMLAVTTVAGLVTGLGAVPTLLGARVGHRVYDAAFGLAGGIVIAASVFGLVIPGMELGTRWEVMAGVLAGGAPLLVGNRLIPHRHVEYTRWGSHGGAADEEGVRPLDDRLRRAVLVGGAITLHNAPAGLAMGIAFASGLAEVAYVLAVVIGLQNVPDGFAFAVPVGQAGTPAPRVLLYATLSGAVPQVAAALVGFGLVAVAENVFPVAAGFAAGAMLGVVFREMVPSSHGHGYEDAATVAFPVGFALLVVVGAVVSV
jgi:ZIP family zinc transporter